MTYATRPRSSARRGDRYREMDVFRARTAIVDREVAMVQDLREAFVGIQLGAAR